MYKLFQYFIHIIKNNLRSVKTILKYPNIHIAHGVEIGLNCNFGKNIKLYKNVVIVNSIVDDYSYIGGNSEIKNCSIGKFCSIAPDVKIGLGMHPTDKISTYPGFYSQSASGVVKIGYDPLIIEEKRVIVGNDVWIGTRSMIIDGVIIGNGAIIAAGSVVTKDVKPYEVVGGVPAKNIKYRFSEEEIKQLEEFRWWDRGLDFCRENVDLFLKPEYFFDFIRKHNEKSS